MSIRPMKQLLLGRPLCRCFMITYRTSSNFSKKRFSGMLWALQFSIFLVSSLIEDFLFISFQQKNEIKKGKYPNGVQIFTFFTRA